MSNLVASLRAVFGNRRFDATDVFAESGNPDLLAAIDAEVPRARYRYRGMRGQLNIRAIRMALRRTEGIKAFHSVRYDGWTFKVQEGKSTR
jgi:hypothetical protein